MIGVKRSEIRFWKLAAAGWLAASATAELAAALQRRVELPAAVPNDRLEAKASPWEVRSRRRLPRIVPGTA